MNIPHDINKQIALRQQYAWKNKQLQYQNRDPIKDYLGTEHLKNAFDRAYDTKGKTFRDVGIAYRVNPLTGEKEMFVAGSGNALDWAFNVSNTLSYGLDKFIFSGHDKRMARRGIKSKRPRLITKLALDRSRQQKGIARKAKLYKPTRMYGHSRAGALVADTKTSAEKIGVDAAMLLANNTNIKNYHRDSYFDKLLGLTGKRNIKTKTGRGIHWAYGN